MDASAKTTSIQAGQMYAGFACDADVRSVASSGGVVSAVLLELLERGHAGALVSKITSSPDGIAAETILVRTREEVLGCAGSSYIDTPVIQTVVRLHDQAGPIAVVALPCQARALRRLMQHRPELREKFWPIIGLFCRGNVTTGFYDDFFRSIGIESSRVRSVKVSRSHVKGRVLVRLDNDHELSIPFMWLNAYRLAGIGAKSLCTWCDEHLAAEADLSVGDIFTKPFKDRQIKHSALVARDEWTRSLIEEMANGGKLSVELVGMDAYERSFKRVQRFSDQQASRKLGALLAGRPRPSGKLSGRFNFFHSLAWSIILLNGKLSRTRLGRRIIFALPRPVITAMALLIKVLSRL